MLRGEIWWVNFSSSTGGEVQKVRPAIIISNDASNKALNRVQVIPMTSNVSKCYPCEAYVELKGKRSKAMADQIVTVSKLRLTSKLGKITHQNLADVERVIRLQLDL